MSKLCFIGGGNMARSLIGGLIERGTDAASIGVAEPADAARQALATDFDVATSADNLAIAAVAEVWILAVKPQVMGAVCRALAGLNRPALAISIAAGVTLGQLRGWLGAAPRLVRVMPNTPALVGEGISALCGEAGLADGDWQTAERIFAAVGETVRVPDEGLMDAVTAVSGSGPAYFFAVIEAMQAAAIEQGLPADTARRLVLRTAIGAARMALPGDPDAAELRRRVTSPGGTTAAALGVLERAGLARMMSSAIAAATERGRQLAAEQES
ncbi:MAG: pyrroline-5-carboxylate reductase [Xanthomonadales bacterium]|nr:pyrroline-5-carboxylate reductase [Xanthomonadales bacterium]MCB1632990.1 pyrroline-5-carboxylate reductase [Xanthomonadales bacterium]MCB1643768.1 pyrroline-5-carboxylate reductase [Xanthomonadales bacterium]